MAETQALRESEALGIYGKARPFLCALFANSIGAV
jgi:hypothetical protein